MDGYLQGVLAEKVLQTSSCFSIICNDITFSCLADPAPSGTSCMRCSDSRADSC